MLRKTSLQTALCRAGLMMGVCLAVFLLPADSSAKDAKSSAAVARMTSDLKYLASDELEGRSVGSKGLNLAAEFIRKEFQKAGLDVTKVNGGAYHTFKMTTGTTLGKPNTLTFLGKDGKPIELKYDTDFRTCSFGNSAKFSGGVVFAGYGIHAPRLKYSDYDKADLKGKVVIIMRRTPQQGNPHSVFQGRSRNEFGSLRHKTAEAFSRGAAAVLLVNDTYTTRREAQRRTKLVETAKDAIVKAAEELDAADKAKPANADKVTAAKKKLSQAVGRLQSLRKVVSGNVDELVKFGYGGDASKAKEPRPIYHITQAACDRLLKATLKKSLAELEEQIDETYKPHTVALPGLTAKGQTALSATEVDVKNVIGVLEGEGPLADETVVVGAHYDHVGFGKYGSRTPGSIHNGADDNASGTVALIELARRLGSAKKKPARRIVFIAFTAEELGLVGSNKYCEKPVFPLNKTVAMINMDMVGRMRKGEVTIFCVGSSPRWKPLIEKHTAKSNPIKPAFRMEMFPRSDHASFARNKIPAIHFFTNTHSDYHRPSDDWDKVNYEGMEDVVSLVEKIVVETVETKERPKFTNPPQPKPVRRTASRWPYFGSQPDYAKQVAGLYIGGTTKGSPADKAGLKKGDIIVKFGRYKIGGIEDYANALGNFKAGDAVEIVVKRDGKEVKLKATLAKPK